ncbi:hypothetical protein A3K86_05240 [Photobacterium jeanii]|uniref:Uncharacterized protein n=1 Tax=Photobacterium jeanii TaxID=858640 RepID=A0A178KM21_9GAMM|nr:hypothetical protein A3K86_05240 [Photobacterium jeanii]PST92020.1 hypothetical protein C9I91_02235 [Photobacterium jeanii]
MFATIVNRASEIISVIGLKSPKLYACFIVIIHATSVNTFIFKNNHAFSISLLNTIWQAETNELLSAISQAKKNGIQSMPFFI